MALDDSSPTLALDISGLGPSMAPRSKKRKLDEAELKEREALCRTVSNHVEPCLVSWVTCQSRFFTCGIDRILVSRIQVVDNYLDPWYQNSICMNFVGYPTYPCSANLAMASWCQCLGAEAHGLHWQRAADMDGVQTLVQCGTPICHDGMTMTGVVLLCSENIV